MRKTIFFLLLFCFSTASLYPINMVNDNECFIIRKNTDNHVTSKQNDNKTKINPKVLVTREVEDCNPRCIEVLTENGPYYCDKKGKKLANPTERDVSYCGTVAHWRYTLQQSKGLYQLQIYTFGPGAPDEEDERFILSDCQPTDFVSFLTGDKEFERDENSSIRGDIEMHQEWIRVGRNGKYGIVAYDYKQPQGVNPKRTVRRSKYWERNILTYPVLKLKGKTLLPIVHDSIIMRRDGLIYFYKDGKVGLFPSDKAPVYDKLEQRTLSFYYIKKDGIEGWLDIKTNNEYFISSDE